MFLAATYIQPRPDHFFAHLYSTSMLIKQFVREFRLRVSRLIRSGMLYFVARHLERVRVMFQKLWFYIPSSSGRFLPHPLGIDFPATTWWKAGQRAGCPAVFAKIAVVIFSSTANSAGLENQLSTVNTSYGFVQIRLGAGKCAKQLHGFEEARLS